jgi:hypothetical protein
MAPRLLPSTCAKGIEVEATENDYIILLADKGQIRCRRLTSILLLIAPT